LGVSQSEQQTIDRGACRPAEDRERAARSSLRAQITRLERELSAIVAEAFPHLSAEYQSAPGAALTAASAGSATVVSAGPSVLGLGQLELLRDELAGRVQQQRRRAAERAEHERRARELLELMKLEPGRYKFMRLPVRDLGQGGCGVWEVRPRLGLIGMLAGWWQVKLSSGCPLPRGPRSTRGPARPT
jgi:hypothetical protein